MEPLSDIGLETWQHIHEVEPVLDMNEDVVEVETANITHTLEELFDILRERLVFFIGS